MKTKPVKVLAGEFATGPRPDWDQWEDLTFMASKYCAENLWRRSGIKPSLRVDLDRYTTDQTFLGLKSFVLRNNSQDASSMHERVTMLLFRRMGLPAPRRNLVDRFVMPTVRHGVIHPAGDMGPELLSSPTPT